MITPAATAPELTARGYQLILRTTGLDSDQGPTAAKYILEEANAAYCYRSRQTAIRRRSGTSGAGRPKEKAMLTWCSLMVSPPGKKHSQRWWRV